MVAFGNGVGPWSDGGETPSVRVVASVVAILVGVVPACGPRVATEHLPTARETLAGVAKRLGRSKDPGENNT